MRHLARSAALLVLILAAAPTRADAAPIDIGVFSWDDFGGPSFSVVNLGSGGDFIDIAVTWTLVDTTSEQELLASVADGDPAGAFTIGSIFTFHEDIVSATLSFRFVAPGTQQDLAGTLAFPVLTGFGDSQTITFEAAAAPVAEPSTLLLLGAGVVALAARRRALSSS
jgi:hypothetical protein